MIECASCSDDQTSSRTPAATAASAWFFPCCVSRAALSTPPPPSSASQWLVSANTARQPAKAAVSSAGLSRCARTTSTPCAVSDRTAGEEGSRVTARTR